MSTDDVRERLRFAAPKTDGTLADGSMPTLKEVNAASPPLRDPSLRRVSDTTLEYSPLAFSDQAPDVPKGGTDRTSKSNIGDAPVEFKDGQISRLTMSTGMTFTRQGDKYVSNDGTAVDSVTYDEKRNEVKIRWATTVSGREETTFIRPTGEESVYSPPSKIMGIDNVRSIEISTSDHGKREVRIRQNDGKLLIGEVTSPVGKGFDVTLNHTLRAPQKMTDKDLAEAAREVAHLIKKNHDNLGNEFDRAYLADVYRTFRRSRSGHQLDEDVNDALIAGGQRGRFELSIFSIRDNSNDVVMLLDRQNRSRAVSSIEVPK